MSEAGAEFGGQMRAERMRRGVSLERLSAETKVNVRHLEELEGGDFGAMPGGVLRKGIVRAYVRALGLEEETWMPLFEASYAAHAEAEWVEEPPAEEAWVAFAENVRKGRGPRRNSVEGRWMGIAALFAAVFAAAWVVWHFMLRARLSS